MLLYLFCDGKTEDNLGQVIVVIIFIIVTIVLRILPIEYLHLFRSQAQRSVSLLEKSIFKNSSAINWSE